MFEKLAEDRFATGLEGDVFLGELLKPAVILGACSAAMRSLNFFP